MSPNPICSHCGGTMTGFAGDYGPLHYRCYQCAPNAAVVQHPGAAKVQALPGLDTPELTEIVSLLQDILAELKHLNTKV
jgi:tRNA(Ile2) C34 agmatinyltransferase TiaS